PSDVRSTAFPTSLPVPPKHFCHCMAPVEETFTIQQSDVGDPARRWLPDTSASFDRVLPVKIAPPSAVARSELQISRPCPPRHSSHFRLPLASILISQTSSARPLTLWLPVTSPSLERVYPPIIYPPSGVTSTE